MNDPLNINININININQATDQQLTTNDASD